ncbi:MAG: methyltransferase domain-containing protein, partial [Gammaproteobacteria bacterium]
FVRRELMYEMRYGASSKNGKSDGLKTKIELLSPDKLETARNEHIRLNLGCGHKPLDGYLNVDRRSLPGIDIVADVDELPFEQGEIDEIFSSHLLEHFPEEQLKRVLLHYWLDLLKPGGVFRAVVPDGDGMIKAYTGGEYPFQRLRDVTYGAQDYDGDFHFNMFTTSSLSELLAEAGFIDIKIIAENRENKGCKEFEISARRREV